MQFKHLNKLNIKNCFQIDIKRFVRRLTPSSKPLNEPKIDEPKPIEIVKEKIDLKSLDLPISARLAIEQDPRILKNFDQSILNEKGEIEIKSLKFSIESELKDLLKETKKPKAISIEDFNLDQDPTCAPSRINCSGCGARLHCQDKHQEGFLEASKFKSLSKKELLYSLCFRCEYLNTKKSFLT